MRSDFRVTRIPITNTDPLQLTDTRKTKKTYININVFKKIYFDYNLPSRTINATKVRENHEKPNPRLLSQL